MNFLATKEIGPQGLHTCISKVKPSHNRKFQSPKPSHRNSVDKNPHTKNSLREAVAQNRTGLDSCKGGPQVWTVARRVALTKGCTTTMFSRGRTTTVHKVHKGSCTTPVHKGSRNTTVLKGSRNTTVLKGSRINYNSPQREPHHTTVLKGSRNNYNKHFNSRWKEGRSKERGSAHLRSSRAYNKKCCEG
jgi:hypothetical protein